MLRLIALIFIMYSCGCGNNLSASFLCQHDDDTFRCVKYVRNYDGDTITFDIPNVHPIIGKSISVRVRGVDTPELHSVNECERQAAKNAKFYTQEILKNSNNIKLTNIQRDKYFRILSDVIVDGPSLGESLIKAGLAVPYDGGTKSNIDWCDKI